MACASLALEGVLLPSPIESLGAHVPQLCLLMRSKSGSSCVTFFTRAYFAAMLGPSPRHSFEYVKPTITPEGLYENEGLVSNNDLDEGYAQQNSLDKILQLI